MAGLPECSRLDPFLVHPMYFQLLILAGLISDTFSFVILPSKVLISTRLDPIVQPGVASTHLHNILGGNRFNATYDSAFLLSSTCTTSPVNADKSSYWAPAMYFMNKTTNPMTYTRIGSSFNIYYLPRGDPGNVKAFPEGFRMVAGDASRNTYNASLFGDQAVSWVCLDYNNSGVNGQETPGFPSINCPDGIRGQVFFPSCWDGVNFDSANHKDHVAYPIQNYNSGDCPSSHPVKLVSLFYEQIFSTGGFNVNGDGQSWILANGDVTGYSYHADFQNGWDSPSILQSVIDQCNADNSDGNMNDCPPLQPYIDEDARDACQLDPTIRIPDEDVGLFHDNSIPVLLGNNPIWLAGQGKPVNSSYIDNVSWGRVGSLSEGVGLRGARPISFNTTAGVQVDDTDASDWESRGCIADSITGRALEGMAITDEPEMNLRKCAILCESHGYSIAGVEFGHECYCDEALRNGVRMDLVANVTCGMPCTGNPYENCGGSKSLVILAKDGVIIRTTGEASSAQTHRLHAYSVLASSLMIMFLVTLL